MKNHTAIGGSRKPKKLLLKFFQWKFEFLFFRAVENRYSHLEIWIRKNDEIVKLFAFNGREAQDRLAEIYTERDAVVREYQKIYKAKIQKEKEEKDGE